MSPPNNLSLLSPFSHLFSPQFIHNNFLLHLHKEDLSKNRDLNSLELFVAIKKRSGAIQNLHQKLRSEKDISLECLAKNYPNAFRFSRLDQKTKKMSEKPDLILDKFVRLEGNLIRVKLDNFSTHRGTNNLTAFAKLELSVFREYQPLNLIKSTELLLKGFNWLAIDSCDLACPYCIADSKIVSILELMRWAREQDESIDDRICGIGRENTLKHISIRSHFLST